MASAALDTAAWLIALAVKSSDPKLTAAEPARAPSLRYELGAGALLDSASLPKVGLGFATFLAAGKTPNTPYIDFTKN